LAIGRLIADYWAGGGGVVALLFLLNDIKNDI